MPRRRRGGPNITLHLVEVGYTSDFRVHDHVQAKLDQHERLVSNLRRSGWREVRLHAFIIGHTGVMRQDNVDILRELGVSPSRVGPFLSHLAVTSLLKTTGILSSFPPLQTAPLHEALTGLPPWGGGSAPVVPTPRTTASGEGGGHSFHVQHIHAPGEQGHSGPFLSPASGASGTSQTSRSCVLADHSFGTPRLASPTALPAKRASPHASVASQLSAITRPFGMHSCHTSIQPCHAAKRSCRRDLRHAFRDVTRSGENAGVQASDRGCVQVQGSTRDSSFPGDVSTWTASSPLCFNPGGQ